MHQKRHARQTEYPAPSVPQAMKLPLGQSGACRDGPCLQQSHWWRTHGQQRRAYEMREQRQHLLVPLGQSQDQKEGSGGLARVGAQRRERQTALEAPAAAAPRQWRAPPPPIGKDRAARPASAAQKREWQDAAKKGAELKEPWEEADR